MYAPLLCLILALAASVAGAQTCVDYAQGIRWRKNFDHDSFITTDLDGNHLYALTDALVVFDVSDPEAPEVVSSIPTPNGAFFDVLDAKLYVVDWLAALQVFDVSDPAQPVLLGSAQGAAQDAAEIVASGDHVYAISDYGFGLRVFDVSDPQAPVDVGGYSGLSYGYGLAASGNQVYVADGPNLRILDITDPAQPALLSTLPAPGSTRCVVVAGTTAYVGVQSATATLLVVDAADPSLPEIVGQLGLGGTVKDVAIAGTRAYVTTPNAVAVVDVSDPANPVLEGKARTHGIAIEVEPAWPNAFVADYEKLQLFDVSHPGVHEPIGSWSTPGSASGVWVQGDLAYIADGEALQIADVSTPAVPSPVGALDIGTYTRGVVVEASIAYVSQRNVSMTTVDVSNPALPVLLDWALNTVYGNSYAVVLSGNYAFNAYGGGGLVVGDVTDPANTFVGGDYETPFATDIAMSGSLVFLADYYDGMIVLDVSTPASPVFKSAVMPAGGAYSVAAQGSFAYFGDASEALHVVDVSDPTNPVVTGTVATPHIPLKISLDGSLAYLACDDTGVHVVDISNPYAPVYVGGIGLSGNAQGIHVVDGLVYVADGVGLKVLPTHCSTPTRVGPGGPGQLALRAWPNPVRSATVLAYALPRAGALRLEVFDPRGRLVRTLVAGTQAAGPQLVRWDARDARGETVANGIYYAKLTWPGGATTSPVTVVR